jgi:protein-disulfide isomerase
MTMKFPARAVLATICLAIALTVGSATICAQGDKTAPPSRAAALTPAATAALQKRVETYLRNVYAWGTGIDVKVGSLDPAPAGDLYQTTVVVSAEGGSDSAVVFVSKDGRYVLRGELDDMNLDPYADVRSKLHIEGAAAKGPKDASVTVVEFGDFECPVCRQLEGVLRAVLPMYPQIRFVFKDFPLESVHPWAMTAAIAGHCALQQSADIFWKFHDEIYDSQDLISPENAVDKLTDLATQAGANPSDLKTCLADPKSTELVRTSLQDGVNVEVNSTPTVFVNGRKFVGPNANLLQQFIDYDLHAQPTPTATTK